jgi:hypothetical protein
VGGKDAASNLSYGAEELAGPVARETPHTIKSRSVHHQPGADHFKGKPREPELSLYGTLKEGGKTEEQDSGFGIQGMHLGFFPGS